MSDYAEPDRRRIVRVGSADRGGIPLSSRERRTNGGPRRVRPLKAPERLQDLLQWYAPHYNQPRSEYDSCATSSSPPSAVTEAEATDSGATHAVLMVHEFRTDQRPEDKTASNMVELHRFVTTVFDCEPPGADWMPWCIEVPTPASMSAKLYIAWGVTDLTTATLRSEDTSR